VPDGVVIPPGAPVDAQALVPLEPLAVRSSAAIEDRAGGSAAGVFASRIGVPAAEAADAVAAVRASAETPLAAAYARRHGAAAIDVAVIVQRFVPGRRITVYTRPPGRAGDDEVWVEPAGAPLVRTRRDDADPRVTLALAAERAIDAARGADVELIEDRDRLWLVQARPIVHPPPPAPRAAPPPALFRFSADTPGVVWRRDVTHNPDPLSPAQAGLVDAVVAAGASPWPMATAAGYLYYAHHPERGREAPESKDAPRSASELLARFDEHAERMNAALEEPDAIAAYVAFFRIYAGDVTPLVSAARRVLPDLLATRCADADALAARLVPRRAGSLDAAIVAAARGDLDEHDLLALAADHAPAWDVAAPTFGEQPELVREAVLRVRAVLHELAPPAPESIAAVAARTGIATDELAGAAAIAAVAAAIAEEDDAYFARAQARVRRALLAAGRAAGLDDPEDACWVPLGELDDPVRVRARAGAARAAAERARAWAMPLTVIDGAPRDVAASPAGLEHRGAGSGPTVTGVVRRVADLALAARVPPGAIALVPTVTPALALVLAGARAIVSAHGGILDHGAAIARELGVPCVVGCASAWDALGDGDLVEVSGDAGIVRRV
jgi:pyruvate,water dikinase